MNFVTPVQIVIADDHEIFRDGLKTLLQKFPGVEIVGEAGTGKEMIEQAMAKKPDIIITDIMMPVMDGIVATRKLIAQWPSAQIIALTMFDQESLVIDILEAGAMGYLLKHSQKSEIKEAIEVVSKGHPFYCRTTSTILARMIAQSKYNPYSKIEKQQFSFKEKQIIQLICDELSNKEIADRLNLSPRTIEGYRLNFMEKMQVKSTAGIVIYAVKNGLYKIVGLE